MNWRNASNLTFLLIPFAFACFAPGARAELPLPERVASMESKIQFLELQISGMNAFLQTLDQGASGTADDGVSSKIDLLEMQVKEINKLVASMRRDIGLLQNTALKPSTKGNDQAQVQSTNSESDGGPSESEIVAVVSAWANPDKLGFDNRGYSVVGFKVKSVDITAKHGFKAGDYPGYWYTVRVQGDYYLQEDIPGPTTAGDSRNSDQSEPKMAEALEYDISREILLTRRDDGTWYLDD